MENKIKKCPHCQLEVDQKATKCPHCKSDMRDWARRHPLLTVFLFVMIVPIFAGQLISETTTPPVANVDQIPSIKKANASYAAQAYVQGVPLKSPSTAKYNRPTVTQTSTNPNVFEAESYIDSQNGYGAMIRSYWTMTLRYNGADNKDAIESGNNWEITGFVFDGEKIK